MTTLVGIRTSTGISYVAADTLVTSPGVRLGAMSKIMVTEGLVENGSEPYDTCIAVSGMATSFLALRSILNQGRYSWRTDLDVYESMLAIHSELREHHGLRPVEDPDNDAYESSQFQALIANRYGLWKMLSCREIIPVDTFTALGSGREFAMGAILALGVNTPELTLRRAIEIASVYDLATGGDMTMWHSVAKTKVSTKELSTGGKTFVLQG